MKKYTYNNLMDSLNYLDEMLEEMGCCEKEKKEIGKCYNFLADFIWDGVNAGVIRYFKSPNN